jgi:hypothetical protein
MLETASGGIGQDTKRKQPSEALTNWRQHREGQVRTQKESDQATGAHILEMVSGGTSQNTKRKRPSDGHSLPGDRVGKEKSGHGKEATG